MVKNPLDVAIKLHEKHMDKPATATAASQVYLMKLLKELDKGKGMTMGTSGKTSHR